MLKTVNCFTLISSNYDTYIVSHNGNALKLQIDDLLFVYPFVISVDIDSIAKLQHSDLQHKVVPAVVSYWEERGL